MRWLRKVFSGRVSKIKKLLPWQTRKAMPAVERLETRELLANSFLQGLAFHDLNANGVFDVNEPRLAGATIQLFRGNEQTPFLTRVTDSNGYYLFNDIAPGNYRLEEIAPAGFWASAAQSLSQINPATVPANTRNRIDVQLVDPESLSGATFYERQNFVHIFEAVRLDGVIPPGFTLDPEEAPVGQFPVDVFRTGLPDIRIQTYCAELAPPTDQFPFGPFRPGARVDAVGYLYNRHGTRTDYTLEQKAGLQLAIWEYLYDAASPNLRAGRFQINFPVGQFAAVEAAATAFVNEARGQAEPVLFLRPTDLLFQAFLGLGSYNFGNQRTASLAGAKWHDLNADGQWNTGEPGLAGWTIQVLQNNNVVRTATTGQDGRYSVTDLLPGNYQIREVLQPDWVRSYPGGTGTHDITLTSGQNYTAPAFSAVVGNFGNYQLGRTSGQVTFRTVECEGFLERGGQNGVRVLLERQVNGQFQLVSEAITPASGNYAFQNLTPGTYRVRQIINDWTQLSGPPAIFTITSGQEVTGLNFRNEFALSVDARCGSIAGQVTFREVVCDGVVERGARSGVTIYIDANMNGRLDDGEQRTVTDASGNYRFTPLGRGQYKIRMLTPTGSTAIGPDLIESNQTEPRFNVTGLNFRLEVGLDVNAQCGSIAGQVTLREPTCDGLVERGGRSGVTIFIDTNMNGRLDDGEPRTVTDTNGNYRFGTLGRGQYKVRMVTPNGTVLVGSDLQETNQTNPIFNVTGLNFKLEGIPSSPLICIPASPDQGKPTVPVFPQVTPPVLINDLGGKGQLLGSTITGEGQTGGVVALAAFVTGVYRGLLNRAPDDFGLVSWVRQLQSGTNRSAVVAAIYNSVEHRGLQVDFYYANYLGRRADPAGRAVWTNALASGLAEKDFLAQLLGSAEFHARSNSDNGLFVSRLYSMVLNRPAETAGYAAWVQAIQSGTSRQAVAQAFVNSRETSKRTVDLVYSAYLDRAVDPAGEQAWLNAMGRGQVSWGGLIQAVLASDEYFARLRTLANAR